MSTKKITIEFPSALHLWAFKNAIQINVFFVNLTERTITFEDSLERIDKAIEKYHGHIVQERQEA